MSTDVDVAILETRMKALEESMNHLKTVVDRLPNWAVWVMIAGAGCIGYLLQWLINCVK